MLTAGADEVTPPPCEGLHHSIPLVVLPTSVHTARAAQPDPLLALVGKVCRLLAPVESGVPHDLNQCIVRMCQRLRPSDFPACNSSN